MDNNSYKTDVSGIDLVDKVASLPPNSNLKLSPGTYVVPKPIVANKDMTIESSTGSAGDVAIVSPGSSALLVKDGSPQFKNITFISTAQSVGAPYGVDDEHVRRSCVAVLKGSPRFIGCKVTSNDATGILASGNDASVTLVQCEIRRTGKMGVSFENGATGSLDECFIGDAGESCLNVQDTPKDRQVEVRNSTICRAGSKSAAPYNIGCVNVLRNGRLKLVGCDVLTTLTPAINLRYSVLVAQSSRFRSDGSIEELIKKSKKEEGYVPPMGCRSLLSDTVFDACVFTGFMFAVGHFGHSERRTLTNCRITDCKFSIATTLGADECQLADCVLCSRPIVISDWNPNGSEDDYENDADNDNKEVIQLVDVDDDGNEEEDDDNDDDDFGKILDNEALERFVAELEDRDDEEATENEEEERGYILRDRSVDPIRPEVFFGRCSYVFPSYQPRLFIEIHPESQYDGTIFVTHNTPFKLFDVYPGNNLFRSYEFAMATSIDCPDVLFAGEQKAVLQPIDSPYGQMSDRCNMVLTTFARLAGRLPLNKESPMRLNRYETLRLPQNFPVPELVGSCFIFDAIGAPENQLLDQIEDCRAIFDAERDRAVPTPDAPKCDSGFMLIVEIFPEEFEQINSEPGRELIKGREFLRRLKASEQWPFSDLNRAPIDLSNV